MLPVSPSAAQKKTLDALSRAVGVSWSVDAGGFQAALQAATRISLRGQPITDLTPLADLDTLEDDPPPPEPALAPALGGAVLQLGAFALLPVGLWAALAPNHSRYIGTCGTLTDTSDRYGVLIPLGETSTGRPAIEVLDPLCPSCRGLEERLAASGQGAQLSRQLLLFPLDASCNWMVSSSLHPGACTVSEALLCAEGAQVPAVLAWAFEQQEEIRTATAADPEAAQRMVVAAFPALGSCVGKPAVRSRLNQSLRWAVKNQLPVLTPQLFVAGQRVCDADTDLGLDYTLARMLEETP